MQEYINTLIKELQTNGDPIIAAQQKAYMKNNFEFFGIKTPQRRALQKPFLVKEFLPPKENLEAIVKTLWQKEHRDLHHFGMELSYKYLRKMEEKDILLYEYMLMHQSWWDTVDMIATKLVGPYFKKFPHQLEHYLEKWLASGNLWLQRTCIIYQLNYKVDLDTLILTRVIEALTGSKEFFINKAIGWALRDYSRIDADWVIQFVAMHDDLSNLSKREALRLLK